ncbi:AAA family ATPase [Larkinella humicola]|uniref:AAA family ATPase n=1 Tax=Larkinella humicola TaxID=2607654 RepID=A0A5N1J827_9BACT|nr:AAA family ATPase [Larkinella humicola]KAA9347124.1 AAA family ATPase [Larkinella humicola]
MLKRVSIQNFKSLKDVKLNLEKVNLLIGPNNSGKTNFLKALESFAIGGINSQNVLDFEAVSYKHQRGKIKYEFDFAPDPTEYMTKSYGKEGRENYHYLQTLEVKVGDGFVNIESFNDDWFTDKSYNKIDTLTYGGDKREFFEFVNTKIFRPDPSKFSHTVKFSADETKLLADCSNLISFYFYIENNYKKKAIEIQENLRKCIPEFSFFTTPPVKSGNESLIGLKFFDKDENGYWANEVSEGVLYFLALLCTINQPNPPKLLLLEEPERGIHPRRIWEVMKFIFQLADEKDIQIILTSHNENVLNEFTSMPEAVFVFDKDEEEGHTKIRNLQTEIIEPSHRKSDDLGLDRINFIENLGENWMYGLLGGVPKDEL